MSATMPQPAKFIAFEAPSDKLSRASQREQKEKEREREKAQEKESKRAMGIMSCAECRRLKLKCDKTVPCSSCKRRGCAEICPNGRLITGHGTRFVLADTEKLHRKITIMSDRIRQLEDALGLLQQTVSHEPHPLLDRELLTIKSSIELHAAPDKSQIKQEEEEELDDSQYIDSMGTLALHDDGAATFYGRSAGTESLLIGEHKQEQAASPHISDSTTALSMATMGPGTSRSIIQGGADYISSLADAFPLSAVPGMTPDMDAQTLARACLPPWPEARQLCSLYLEQAPWFFGAVKEAQITREILPMWYEEAADMAPPRTPSNLLLPQLQDRNSQGQQGNKGTAHDLALLFIIFCFGALTDLNRPPAPDNEDADRYFKLSRAAMALEPVLDRPVSVATVQTLSLMGIYQGLVSGENSIESTWALMGLACKLAQSIGLHRDSARWKLSPQEVEKRRALFWELFITDGWQALATGRLPTFSLPYVDCELPADPDARIGPNGEIDPSFLAWKAKFGFTCMSGVVRDTLTSKAPKYSRIVDLDRQIREVEIPRYAQGPCPQGLGLAETMSHFMPHNYIHFTLLYVHRTFFANAINKYPGDPLKSPFGPSFLAGFRSATELLGSLRRQFDIFPTQVARFWVLWTHAFSSVVMLASVVTHSPKSRVAYAAWLDLQAAKDLFAQAAKHGGRAGKFLPIIQRLSDKAGKIFQDTYNGMPPPYAKGIFQPSSLNAEKDELSIFSGETHTVSVVQQQSSATRTNSKGVKTTSATTTTTTTTAAAESSMTAMSGIETPPGSFANAHPSLLHEMYNFDQILDKQILQSPRMTQSFAQQQQQQPQQRQITPEQHMQPFIVPSSSAGPSHSVSVTVSVTTPPAAPPSQHVYQVQQYQQQQPQMQQQNYSSPPPPPSGTAAVRPQYTGSQQQQQQPHHAHTAGAQYGSHLKQQQQHHYQQQQQQQQQHSGQSPLHSHVLRHNSSQANLQHQYNLQRRDSVPYAQMQMHHQAEQQQHHQQQQQQQQQHQQQHTSHQGHYVAPESPPEHLQYQQHTPQHHYGSSMSGGYAASSSSQSYSHDVNSSASPPDYNSGSYSSTSPYASYSPQQQQQQSYRFGSHGSLPGLNMVGAGAQYVGMHSSQSPESSAYPSPSQTYTQTTISSSSSVVAEDRPSSSSMQWPGDTNYSIQQQQQPQQTHPQYAHYTQEQQQQQQQQQQMYGAAHGMPDVSGTNMYEDWQSFFGSQMRGQ